MSYARTQGSDVVLYAAGQGSVPDPEGFDPRDWIRTWWDAYVELWPKLLGLQHEAATLAAASEPGTLLHDTARRVVDGAATLMRIHARVQKTVETYSGALGLGAIGTTLTLSAIFVAIAGIMYWSFLRYDALRETLDRVDAGTLTPDEADALLSSAGPTPDLSVVGGLGLGTVLGAAAVVWLFWWLGSRRRENPDLVVLGANPQPDGVWSHRVLAMDYIHDDDNQAYTHSFRPGVRMQALEDGSVRLYNPRRRIWKEF